MPPKVKFSREDLIEAGFDLVRESGQESLTARKIGERLNCSTRPVYSAFQSMDELENAVAEKAGDFVLNNYMLNDRMEHNFLHIGMGYIRLALEDKELFRFLYLSGRIAISPEMDLWPVDSSKLIEAMKKDKHLQGLDEPTLNRILRRMWIYTHGLTTLAVSNPGLFTLEFMENELNEMGYTVISWEFMNKGREE